LSSGAPGLIFATKECGGSQEMVYGFSILREPWLPIIDHHTPIGVHPKELTHVALF